MEGIVVHKALQNRHPHRHHLLSLSPKVNTTPSLSLSPLSLEFWFEFSHQSDDPSYDLACYLGQGTDGPRSGGRFSKPSSPRWALLIWSLHIFAKKKISFLFLFLKFCRGIQGAWLQIISLFKFGILCRQEKKFLFGFFGGLCNNACWFWGIKLCLCWLISGSVHLYKVHAFYSSEFFAFLLLLLQFNFSVVGAFGLNWTDLWFFTGARRCWALLESERGPLLSLVQHFRYLKALIFWLLRCLEPHSQSKMCLKIAYILLFVRIVYILHLFYECLLFIPTVESLSVLVQLVLVDLNECFK